LASKTILLSLVAVIVVTWLLAASITQIQPISGSPGNSGTNSGGGGSSGSGGSTGFGGGTGSGLGGSGLGGSFGFNLPHFNFTLPKFNLNLSMFNIHFPKLSFTLPSLGNIFGFGGSGSSAGSGGSGSSGSGGSGSGGGSGGGGSSGGSGGSGSSGSGGSGSAGGSGSGGTSASTTPHPVLPHVNQILIIIIISIVAVFAVVLTLSKMSFSRKKDSAEEENGNDLLLSVATADEDESMNNLEISIGAGETIAPLKGWSSGNDIIRPDIKPDLPLIWSSGDNLSIDYDPDETLKSSCGIHMETAGKATLTPTNGCNVIEAGVGRRREMKFIRGVRYESDVIDLVRLNIIKETDFHNEDLTIREIIDKIPIGRNLKDRGELPLLVEIFERSFYGKMKLDRKGYEDFLYGLSKTMTKPKVIICKGDSDTN
jgi:hypothetical protein